MKKKKNKDLIRKKKLLKKNNFLNKLNILQKKIKNYSKNVPLNDIFLNKKQIIDTDSFYDMSVYDLNIKDTNTHIYDLDKVEIPDKIYKCQKICLIPTPTQTKLLLDMLEGYRLIYNETLKFIKKRNYLHNLQIKNLTKIKDELKNTNKKQKLTNNEKEKLKIDKEQKKIDKEHKKINITKEEEIEEKKKRRIEKISRVLKDDNFEPIYDYKIIRTYFLKNKISEIADKYKTPVHTLDKAVSLACASFKSCISNLRNGNIKYFKVREIKKTKSSLMMDIEKTSFTKDGKSFIKFVLGDEVKNKKNQKYIINSDCKIHYNKVKKKFILLVPEQVEIKENKNNNYISIDPGLRTFLNCITNNSYIEIGTNIRKKLKKEIKLMDKHSTIKNSKRKRRYINIIKERMKNQVNDSHWKIINYLTNTYKTILIGKWSTKSIISNKKSILCNMDKRVIQKLSFYQFIEKLKYKCLIKSVDLKLVDEHYTSKVCTNCSNFYKDLKGEEIYNCTKCNIKIKRDYNGSRNIFLKSIKLQDI